MAEIIPPEFYGLYGLGSSLQQLGEKQETRRRTRRQEQREDVADKQAIEDAALRRGMALIDLGRENPGETGIELRRRGFELLGKHGIAPTDARVEPSIQDLQAQAIVSAWRKPAWERTDEDLVLISPVLGLEPGATAEDARNLINNRVAESGLNLDLLRDSVDAREQYRAFLREKNYSEGQLEFETGAAGIGLTEAQTDESRARAEALRRQAEAAGAEANAAYVEARSRLLQPFFETLATHGVDSRVANRLFMEEELTPEEEQRVTDALASAADAASAPLDKMRVAATILGIEELGSGAHGAALAYIGEQLFGEDVVTVMRAGEGLRRGPPRWEVSLDLSKAILGAGGTPEDVNSLRGMEEEVAGIVSVEEWQIAVADAVSQPDNWALKPLLLQLLQQRGQELGAPAEELSEEPAATPAPAAQDTTLIDRLKAAADRRPQGREATARFNGIARALESQYARRQQLIDSISGTGTATQRLQLDTLNSHITELETTARSLLGGS